MNPNLEIRNFWMEERIDIELKFEISVITGRK